MELKEIKFYLKRLYQNYVKEHMWSLYLAAYTFPDCGWDNHSFYSLAS